MFNIRAVGRGSKDGLNLGLGPKDRGQGTRYTQAVEIVNSGMFERSGD